MSTKRRVNHKFFSTWNPAMAYVLGFFVADGTLTYTKRGGKYIGFHITDRALLFEIRTLMESTHKIATRNRGGNSKPGYRLQIGSINLCNDIARFGFTPNKSKTVRLPSIPRAYVGEFTRGYFDGDGCVYFNILHTKDRKSTRPVFQVKFTSGSKNFLKDLLELLRKHGVNGGFIVTKRRGFELAFSHKDGLAIYRLMYNNTPTCDVHLKRKKKIFDRAFHIMYGMRT